MADVSLDDLIARARLESGLRDNAYYDSDQIVKYLDSGGSELADVFTNANQHYVIKTFDFTTTGPGAAAVTLPDDFQQGHSLEIYPDVRGQTRTIRFLSNWLNRNAFAGNVFALAPGGGDPAYTLLGNQLRFYPPQATPAAPFRLYYTPKWKTLARPTTPPARTVSLDTGGVVAALGLWTFPTAGTFTASDIGATFTVAGAVNPGNNGAHVIGAVLSGTQVRTQSAGLVNETFGVGDTAAIQPVSSGSRTITAQPSDTYNGSERSWSITDAGFTASDVGAVLTVELAAPNTGINGEYVIEVVASSTLVEVRSTGATSSIGPVSGSFTVDRHQVGTNMALPSIYAPWSDYLSVYAGIAINTDRQRGTSELERKLNALKARIASTIGQRQEEPQQPPLSRGVGGGWDGGWGGIGGW